MARRKKRNPLLLPPPDGKKREAELALLRQLNDKNSPLFKKLEAEGKYKVVEAVEAPDQNEPVFDEETQKFRAEEVGSRDGNYRVLKQEEAEARLQASRGQEYDS